MTESKRKEPVQMYSSISEFENRVLPRDTAERLRQHEDATPAASGAELAQALLTRVERKVRDAAGLSAPQF